MLCPQHSLSSTKGAIASPMSSTSSRWCRACANTRWKATATSICRAISCLTSNTPTVFLLLAIRKDARFRSGWRVPGRSNSWRSPLGIDAPGLGETITRFNMFARNGADADFGRGRAIWSLARKDQWKPTRADETYVCPGLGTLRIPPFYGVELHPSAFASGGLLRTVTGRSSTTGEHRLWACMPPEMPRPIPSTGSATRPGIRSDRL